MTAVCLLPSAWRLVVALVRIWSISLSSYLIVARLALLFFTDPHNLLPLEFHVKDHFAANNKRQLSLDSLQVLLALNKLFDI